MSILILANKQDLKGAYTADALRTELDISKLLRNQKRMLKVRLAGYGNCRRSGQPLVKPRGLTVRHISAYCRCWSVP